MNIKGDDVKDTSQESDIANVTKTLFGTLETRVKATVTPTLNFGVLMVGASAKPQPTNNLQTKLGLVLMNLHDERRARVDAHVQVRAILDRAEKYQDNQAEADMSIASSQSRSVKSVTKERRSRVLDMGLLLKLPKLLEHGPQNLPQRINDNAKSR